MTAGLSTLDPSKGLIGHRRQFILRGPVWVRLRQCKQLRGQNQESRNRIKLLMLKPPQIVLASGQIVNANAQSYSDLFKALKGGTNNFGIVTRFDLKTFQQGKLWGGFIVYPWTNVPAQLQALQDFTSASGAGVDDYASVINAFLIGSDGPEYIANQYTYSKAQEYPLVLQNFTSLQPQYSNSMRITNLTNITIETGSGTPNGYR